MQTFQNCLQSGICEHREYVKNENKKKEIETVYACVCLVKNKYENRWDDREGKREQRNEIDKHSNAKRNRDRAS